MYSIIKSKKQYKKYLNRFEDIFDCKEGSLEENELELLGLLIDKYESEKIPIPDSDPIDTLKFVMDQGNLTKTYLANILNSASRATELLSKKRKLSINHIRLINSNMNIPADTLIKDYKLTN